MLIRNEWVDMPKFQAETELDEETVLELYPVFLEELREERAGIAQAGAERNWSLCYRLVHNVKGISASYRASDVHANAMQVDLLFKGGNDTAAGERVPQLLTSMDGTIRSLEIILGKDGKPA